MKVIKEILKININGELVQYNNKLRRWELTSRSWSWEDISAEHLAESRENWERTHKDAE